MFINYCLLIIVYCLILPIVYCLLTIDNRQLTVNPLPIPGQP